MIELIEETKMPLIGDAKRQWDRNYRRSMRYGPWRQLFYNKWGMCEVCGTTSELDIHEVTVAIMVVEYHLLCLKDHIDGPHNGKHYAYRKYISHLAEDVHRELVECGSIELWLSRYNVRDSDPDTLLFWRSFVMGLVGEL
jgi:hypothetical protein